MIEEKHSQEVLKITEEIIETTGPRLAGTPASKRAAEIICSYLKQHCDTAYLEEFEFHREAFLSFLKILAITYPISVIGMFLGGSFIYLSAICLLVGAIIAVGEFVLYWELIDIFFKKTKGYNVVGKTEPKKKAKQVIIISSHHDSAYVVNFLKRWQKLYAPRVVLGILIYYSAAILTLFWVIHKIFSGNNLMLFNYLPYIFLVLFPFVFQFYFFKSKKVTPGAGDNLLGSIIGIKISETFKQAPLHHTRLIILSTDAEESGLRGARNFVKKNKKELSSLPTFAFNIDSIYRLNELSFLTSDINGIIKLSKEETHCGVRIAWSLGYKVTSAPFTFGGGATDAAEFAKSGIETVSLIGMENKLIRDNLVYHTMNDTPDKIEPAAVLACLKIISQYILEKDAAIDKASINCPK